MKTQLEDIEKGKVKLILEFDKTDSNKAYNIVLKEISKDIKVPGFMAGKIPRTIIEERVGKNSIQAKAVEKLISENLYKAISEKNIDLISQPILENSNFDFDNTLNVSLILETRPEVKIENYKGIKVEIPKSEMKGVTTDTLMEDLRRQLSPWATAPENSIVEEDDILTMDFSGKFLDGSEMPDNEGKDIRVNVKKDNFAPGVMEQLIGSKIGETKVIKTNFPADYDDRDFAGKEAEFTVTAKKIERQDLLPVNEELAAKAGQKDLEALKLSLEFQLEKSKENIIRSRSQAAILSKILVDANVEIPDWLAEREARAHLDKNHHSHHHADGTECNHDHEEIEKELTEELIATAKNKLKFNLVLAEIARKEKIQLTRKELDAYMQYWKQMRQVMAQGSANEEIPPGIINQMAEELLFEKISDWLIKEANVDLIEETDENLKKLEEVQNSLSQFLTLNHSH